MRPRDGEANQASAVGLLSSDARDVVFCSTASNLGPGVTAAGAKTVVWNRLSGAITYANPAAPATSSDCGFSRLEAGISRRVQRTVPMRAASRLTIDMGEFPFVDQRRLAVTALALGNSPISLVVGRATYWTAGGVFWAAGTNAVATPLPWTAGPQPMRRP